MSICLRTLQMDRIELNFPLIKEYLEDQECSRSMCQLITVSMATTPAVFANPHKCKHKQRENSTIAIPRKPHSSLLTQTRISFKANVTAEWLAVLVRSRYVLGFSYEPEMEYLDRKRSYFSSVPQDKRRHSTLN